MCPHENFEFLGKFFSFYGLGKICKFFWSTSSLKMPFLTSHFNGVYVTKELSVQ